LIRSMTAYGRGEHSEGDTAFTAELKSLNNRYRDIILRIPKTFQALEDEIRSQIASKVRRGRIEVSIQMEKNAAEAEYDLELNLPLVRSLIQIFEELNERFGLDDKIAPETLCQMRDVILYKPHDVDIDKARPALQEVLRLALDSLDKMRMVEGQAIEADFLKRLKLIEAYLDDIEQSAPTMIEAYQKRLKEKIQNISQDVELDESRLMQEVAILADRCDITEEIVRLRSHLKQFQSYMSVDDSIGRRLDFLIQEINREVNTISSKTFDSSISAKVVEIKGELEKLREQVQNVE
jgi:uncharacterized protein (TIGR00255 family)